MAGFMGQMLTDQGKEHLNMLEYLVDQTVKKMAVNRENLTLFKDAKCQAVLCARLSLDIVFVNVFCRFV